MRSQGRAPTRATSRRRRGGWTRERQQSQQQSRQQLRQQWLWRKSALTALLVRYVRQPVLLFGAGSQGWRKAGGGAIKEAGGLSVALILRGALMGTLCTDACSVLLFPPVPASHVLPKQDRQYYITTSRAASAGPC